MSLESITLGYIFNLFLFFLPGVVIYSIKNLRYYNFYPNVKIKEAIVESIFYTIINYFILKGISILRIDNDIIKITLLLITLIIIATITISTHKNRKNNNEKIISTIFTICHCLLFIVAAKAFNFKTVLSLIDIKNNYEFSNVLLVSSYLIIPYMVGTVLATMESRIPIFFPKGFVIKKSVTKCEITDKSNNIKYIGFLNKIIFEENVRIIIETDENKQFFLELKRSDLIIKGLEEKKYI